MTDGTLVLLAAGRAVRFGGGKQFFAIGPAGETFIDYALHDAWRAGLRRAVLVVRPDDEAACLARYAARWGERLRLETAVQPAPVGTADAVLRAFPLVHGPFGVANADDFYGSHAFEVLTGFIRTGDEGVLVTYPLGETLPSRGGVSRAVCRVGPGDTLSAVEERLEVHRDAGLIVCPAERGPLAPELPISMNLWGFPSSARAALGAAFAARSRAGTPGELTLPALVDDCLRAGTLTVRVRPSGSAWVGLTRREDVPEVAERLRALTADYPTPVWA